MAMAEKKQFARNDLLVEPKWVEEHLHDSDVRLIDLSDGLPEWVAAGNDMESVVDGATTMHR
jgi:3-mercaptopyruvate sulfurtransferase SseA